MEHRYHQRFPVRLEVLIHLRDGPSGRGVVRNASRSGVFVETRCPRLHEHQQLALEFGLRDGSVRKWCRVGAYVLRCAGNGVALEIDDSDPKSTEYLDRLLDSAVDASVSRRKENDVRRR